MVSPHYFIPVLLFLVATATSDDTNSTGYRLPKNIIPSHYVIELTIDPEEVQYSGFVEITITGTNTTTNNTVELHASPGYITVKNYALLDYSDNCTISVVVEDNEIIIINCADGALEGEHKLTLEFTGELSTDNKSGVFQSVYSEDNTTEVLVATNFEPVYARRAFPCFDEPTLKATFDIYITRPDSYHVLGNTPEEEDFNIGDGQLQTKFTTSPLMSTYQVAFVISKLETSLDVQNENYTYKVYSRSSLKNKLNVVSTYGPSLMEKLSEWTAIPYDALGDRQIDQVLIPDVEASNTENWGLVTFKEDDLLDEGPQTTQKVKQRIITTLAHELTDQWFADYVSPDWWSDTWISEGFATYFQYYIPDLLDGDNYELENQFVVNVLQNVLQEDGLTASPLSSNETDINSDEADSSKFDDITFYKGASIVRMIKGMAGVEQFQKGIRKYLREHQYNSTNVEELLEEIMYGRFASDFAIKTWLYQPGYPLLSAAYEQDMKRVRISQEPFGWNETNTTDTTPRWYIPISYTTSEERDFSINMKDILVPGYRNTIDNIKNTSWLILNMQQHGYYRVNYDDWLWDKIITALKTDEDRKDIHALNRAQLLDDIFNLGIIGKVDYNRVFDLAEYLQYETDYYPWVSGLNALTTLGDKLESNETGTLLKSTIRSWWTNAMEKRKNESTDTNPLKEAFMLEWSCKLDLDDCINYTTRAFTQFKTIRSIENYNERATIFCYGFRNSPDPIQDFYFLLDVYQNSTSADERGDILTGLGCSLNDTVLSLYLAETISNSSALRIEDGPAAYRSMYMSGDLGLYAVLNLAFTSAYSIIAKYPDMRVLTSILTGAAPKLRTSDLMGQIDKIVDYWSELDDILICAWQISYLLEAKKEFNKTYGEIINDILKGSEASGGYLPQPNYPFSLGISLVLFYFYR